MLWKNAIERLRGALAAAAAAAVLAWMPPAGAQPYFGSISPTSGPIGGGITVRIGPVYVDSPNLYTRAVTFGGIPSPRIWWDAQCGNDIPGQPDCSNYQLVCRVPPGAAPGKVDVVIELDNVPDEVLPMAFEYLAGPSVTGVSPNEHSILPDTRPVEIEGSGFWLDPLPQVFFGGRPAAVSEVSNTGRTITCVPPPFEAGNPYPQAVDVRVVNPDGAETTAAGLFTYTQIVPVIHTWSTNGFSIPAWTIGIRTTFYGERFLKNSGNMFVYIENKNIICYETSDCFNADGLICTLLPPMPPGTYDVTIVNPDGGTYVIEDGLVYAGEPAADVHTADRDGDLRIGLSEILRVIQLYATARHHCDPAGEDGFAPGDGDRACEPHDSDYAPQNWSISLSEVLQLVQFYTQTLYHTCADDPSGFCAAEGTFRDCLP